MPGKPRDTTWQFAPLYGAPTAPRCQAPGNRVVFLFICRKVFCRAPGVCPAYLCARPLAGRAGTPKGQRISGKIGGSAAGNAHCRAPCAQTRIHAPRHKHRRAPNAYRHTPDTRRDTRAIAHAYAHTRETAPPAAFRGMSRGFPRDFGANREHRAQHVSCALPRGGARFFA